jgi:hypothetical protein
MIHGARQSGEKKKQKAKKWKKEERCCWLLVPRVRACCAAGWAGFGPVRSAPGFFFHLTVLKYCFSFKPLKQPIKIWKNS